MLIDTHAHLTSSRFKKDLGDVIARAADAGVERILTIGCDVTSSRESLEIAEKFPCVHAAVGVHPCYVMEETHDDWLEQIAQFAAHPKALAIGEIGLDFYHEPPTGVSWETYKARQADFFNSQMELAASLGKNIVVHQRNSFADTVSLVGGFADRLKAQFHCFINSWEDAAPLIAAGHVISFTGIATYPKAPEVLECATQAASGSFMLETDAPYLTPQAHRGQRCEPAFVRETATVIAAARNTSLEELAHQTTQRAEAFFGFPD